MHNVKNSVHTLHSGHEHIYVCIVNPLCIKGFFCLFSILLLDYDQRYRVRHENAQQYICAELGVDEKYLAHLFLHFLFIFMKLFSLFGWHPETCHLIFMWQYIDFVVPYNIWQEKCLRWSLQYSCRFMQSDVLLIAVEHTAQIWILNPSNLCCIQKQSMLIKLWDAAGLMWLLKFQ